jgi:L-ascorbate metabolism protein UlaG (beta-lactamase superfamily)
MPSNARAQSAHLFNGRTAMKITQLRNATIIVETGAFNILVDPMLAPKGALPPLKFLGERLRNPLVDLPVQADFMLESVTHCLITHCQKGHFDHLDRAGTRWLRERQIPIICTPHDVAHLRQRGLNVQPLQDNHREPQPFLRGRIRTVPCRHGKGAIGLLMEHGVGYFIEMPGEPSLYLSGDTILTDEVLDFVSHHQPGISVIPAGGARFDVGQEIIMGERDVMGFARAANGIVIANHLEALSHCPVQRTQLKRGAELAGIGDRLHVPSDGETLEFPGTESKAA